ncbi:PREDICTED: polyadenylate-binding protein 2-like isoform X2 [Erythranthe guttata]|uniref:polyadenylate-binding protein 2-like isoform X2 n=1 Tax=Erythranthe guttata TaxID=4155 RepID=UPI00064DFBB7|nr:PREDICTED: polyadenylate-binding protein 2-like isoform X2 [Erythranthe guttata]|eukprot:XP_012836927.1 PREDICTED: polyadenylate-binding protein 2-like isoform X2 [Erythranthe guttata]
MAAQVQVQQPQVQVANVASSGGAPPVTSLYVGDLEANITDSQLYDLFQQIGEVVSVRICRDLTSRESLGYGYVNYGDPQHAERALEELNFTPFNGRPIRIMYSHRDPSVRRSGAGNIYIKNLDKEIDHKALHDTFSTFGNILSCKVATDSSDQSMGYGFVQYASEDSAQRAIESLNGMLLNGKQVYVGPFLRKQEREMSVDKTKFKNVFVKNLSDSTTEADLDKIFGEYGSLTSAAVMRNEDGTSKCFGFVNFESAEDAARAVESLNGQKFDNKEWYVGRAQKKSEREMELKHRLDQSLKEAAENSQGTNLYVKNLDDGIDDDKLKELFSPFGSITSCKVMRDPKGISRGSGFVAFSSPDEANRALSEMNGKIVVNKPLYVALAQKKEDRKAQLQAQFSQMRPTAMVPSVNPRMPMYAPGLGQQIFYGQPPPAIIPQMVPRGRGYRYPGGRGMSNVSSHGGMFSVPYQMGNMPSHDGGMSRPTPIGALTSALANSSPTEQRTMLGENLYPLVEQLEPETAAKVTGMLLEMDQTEVLHLLESPEALKAKVVEAMEVLRNVSNDQATKQLASLSLKE